MTKPQSCPICGEVMTTLFQGQDKDIRMKFLECPTCGYTWWQEEQYVKRITDNTRSALAETLAQMPNPGSPSNMTDEKRDRLARMTSKTMKLVDECFDIERVEDVRDFVANALSADVSSETDIADALRTAFEVGYTVGQGCSYTGTFEE